MNKISFVKTDENAKLPKKAHDTDACSDLYSVQDISIEPGKTKLIKTGLKVAKIPHGYRLSIFDRSGFRIKGIFGSSVGIVDENYRGELGVILYNSTENVLEIKIGDRIAQCALEVVEPVTYEFVENVEDSDRGSGGFGSTGRN